VSGRAKTVGELVAAEVLKLRTTRTMLVLTIISLVITVGFTLLLLILLRPQELTGDEAMVGLTYPGAIVGLMMILAGILGICSEFRYGTITYTFLATPRRVYVVLLKLGFFFTIGVVAALGTLVLIQALIVVVLSIRGIDILWPHHDLWPYFGRVVLTTGLFGAFGVALGALLRSQVVAVAVTLSWVVLEQMLVTPILMATSHEAVAKWLPLTVFTEVTGSPFDSGGDAVGATGGTMLSPSTALLIGVCYIAAASLAAVFTTMRRDVT
jgi:ABC-2 type transport system permease protein